MKTKKLLLALVFPVISFAQIGIGTSNVDASAKLQIDATNKGFLQPRVALTGTNDTATISSPATGLMVFNTATAGSGSAAVTPGLYYHNGASWQRVANQAEVTEATTPIPTTFVDGNLGTTWNAESGEFDPYVFLGAKNFGASITLPPGKWEVVLELNAVFEYILEVNPAIVWMNYWLDDNTPSNSFVYWGVITNTSIGTSDALFTGAASMVRPVEHGVSNHKGTFFINNTSAVDKTYSLYFFETLPYSTCENNNCIRIFYRGFGGNGWPGNRFYATKIN